MIRFLFIPLLISFCSGTVINHGHNQERSVHINPYTMKYLQQMASQTANVKQQQHQLYHRQQQPKISLQPLPTSSKLSIQPLGVKPLLVKPVYGQTYLNQKPATTSNSKPASPSVIQGKYTFAQVKQANTNNGKNVNPILVALPNLGNLLYKYAQKQVATQKTPVYNQNLYHMFGRQTYGPMPVPTATSYTATSPQHQPKQPSQSPAYSQQQYSSSNSKYGNSVRNTIYRTDNNQQNPQSKVTYRSQSIQQAPQPQVSYAAQMAGNTAFQSQTLSARNGYNAQASSGGGGVKYVAIPAPDPSPTEISYSDTAGNIHIGGGYGDVASGADWGGMLYISGPADEIVNVIQKHPHMPTGIGSPSLTRYSPDVVQLNGDTSNFGQGVAKTIGAGTTCGAIPGAFCRDRKPGHYTNPGSRHCFIQCDAFGRGYNKECAPGTFWNVRGPEPALYNMCS